MARSRSASAGVGAFLCLAVVAALVFFAVNADGRVGSESSTNDGGAWLVNRRTGAIGHVNRTVGELSSAVRVSQPGASFAVLQPAGVVVAHDLTSQALEIVDERTHLKVNSLPLPNGAIVREYATGVVIVAEGPFRLWRVASNELAELATLDAIAPLVETESSSAWQVSHYGDVAYDDSLAGELLVHRVDGVVERWTRSQALGEILFDGRQPVATLGGRLARTNGDRLETVGDELGGWHLAQLMSPERTGSLVSVTSDGRLRRVDTTTGQVEVVGQLEGSGFGAPLVHNGCVHAVMNEPPTYWVRCGAGESRSRLLATGPGPGPDLALRLVNGWVWINDLSTSTLWMVDDQLELSRIDDWGAVLPQNENLEDQELSSAQSADDIVDEVENPDAEDAETVDADQFDEDGVNQPPVAFDDDDVQTHPGRPVVIDVVANDEDPDNDVLLISNVENLSGSDAIVQATIDGTRVQVTPVASFEGVIRYSYTINDGRGGSDSASGSVTVRARTGADNQPPVAVTDVGSIASGEKLIINVISNDIDPDGDSLVLISANTGDGSITFDPSGQVIFEPTTVSEEGEVELTYVIADDFGETAEGVVRVNLRLKDSNQPPDARNDGGITVVGQPVTINLLLNDTDPDGDDLFVANRPVLMSPPDTEVFTTITADGEFVFIPEQPGTYLFSYGASDEEETDLAQIRIEVSEAVGNRPPIAVRDDVVIPGGESRLVYALTNDGDPDGDVVGIVDFDVTPGSGLIVELFGDEGFRVFVDEQGSPRRTFRYSISDGESDPVQTVVVVAVADPATINQPPIAQPDVVEVRPGTTTSVAVLDNDFDPEGSPLRVVAVSSVDGATTEVGADNQFVRVRVDSTTTSSFNVTYEVVDDQGNRSASVIRVQVVAAGQPNRPPVARPDSARTLFEQPLVLSVTANDSDPDGDAFSVEAITRQPANGRAEFDTETGEIIYTPAPRYSGTDRLSYSIVDAFGAQAEGEVLVGVMPEPVANRDPIAVDDLFITIATGASIDLAVLVNDSDPDGDQLRIVDVQDPEIGSVSAALDGRQLTFTAPTQQDVDREVRFDYTISDGSGGSATGEITVLVQATPEQLQSGAPVAVDDDAGTYATGDEIRVQVVANDQDADTPIADLTVTAFDPEVRVEGQSLVIIAPSDDAEYTYQITDPQGNQDTATVTVSIVNPVPPVAVDDSFGPVARDDVVDIPVLVNDYDTDGELGALEIVSVTGEGAQVGTDVIRVTAPAESAQYTYTIQDEDGLEATATISLIVTENRAPVVSDQRFTTAFEESIEIDLSTAGGDPDGDPLFYSCCQSARNGSPEVLDAGEGLLIVRFTPDDGFDGDAALSFDVDDQFGHIVAGSVTIEVLEQPNRPPTAVDGALTIQVPRPGGPRVSETLDLEPITNDPDLDDELTFSIVEGPGQNLSASIVGSLLEVVATDAADPGTTTITWQVTDAEGETAEARVDVAIAEPTNQPPVSSDLTVTLPAGTSDSADLAAWVSDTDENEILSYEIDAATTSGIVVSRTGNSTATVAAAVNTSGSTESVNYTVTDRLGETSTSSLTVEVGDPLEDPPVAVADTATTVQGKAVIIPVLDNDDDPLNQRLTIFDTGTTDAGTVSIVGSTISFVPASSFFTTASRKAEFEYTIRDAADVASRESSATVTVTVIGKPDAPTAPTCTPASTLVDLLWTTPNGNGAPVDEYQVEHDKAPAETPPTDAGAGNSYKWTGLTNDTDYKFRVYAINVAGTSAPSDWSEVCTPDIKPEQPEPPTVVHREGGGALEVSWVKPETSGSAVTSYELKIGGGSPVPVTGETYTWEGLTNGTKYTFQVAAVNKVGPSDFSSPSTHEHPSKKPDAPDIGLTTRSTLIGTDINTLQTNWTLLEPRIEDGGDDVDFYRVDRRPAPAGFTPIKASGQLTNSYLWSGLSNATSYEFRVRAHNRDGVGDWSEWSAPMQICTAPGVPSITEVTPGDEEVDVTFAAPENNGGCEVTEYSIKVAGTEGPGISRTMPELATIDTVTIGGLMNNETYAFQVQAHNVVGASDWVTSSSVKPRGAPICGSSIEVTEIDRTSQTITWGAANFNGGSTNSYRRSENGGPWLESGEVSPHNGHHVVYLAANDPHTVALRAYNEAGFTACGSVTFTACPTAPLQPAKPGISVLANGQMPITFSHPPIPCVSQPPVAGDFSIAYSQVESTSGPALPNIPGTIAGVDLSDGTLFPPGTTERGRVRGCFSDGVCGPWSPWSDWATVPQPGVSIARGAADTAPPGNCWLTTEDDPYDQNRGCYVLDVTITGTSLHTKCFASTNIFGYFHWGSFGWGEQFVGTASRCSFSQGGGSIVVIAGTEPVPWDILEGQIPPNVSVPSPWIASNVIDPWPTD